MLVAFVVAAAAGGVVLPQVIGGGGGQTLANVWVDTTAGGSPQRCASACEYDSTNAYSSINAAIRACTAGDTIRMKAGTYGNQSITTDRSSACPVIAEDGTTIGDLTTHGNFFTLENVDVNGGWTLNQPGVTDITLRDVNFEGGMLFLDAEGYSNITWDGGSFSNFSCSSCAQGMGIYAGETVNGTSVASNITIDGVTFDNIDNTGGTGNHFEVIRVDGKVDGFTLKNSSIINSNPSSSLIFFTTFRGTKPTDITLENNLFGSNGDAFFAINENYLGSSCANWAVRYNTFQGAPAADGNCSGYSNVVWTGNLAPAGSACPGSSFVDNVWYGTGSTCDASDLVIGSSGLGADGLHLQAGSGAIDQGGTGADCIRTDHDGGPRSVGARCDAGADERQ